MQKGRMNNRGQQFTNFIFGTAVGIAVLVFGLFAVLYGVAVLNPSGFFTAGSADANATLNLQRNLTSGVSQFGAQIPTVMVILGVVLAIAAIVILVRYIRGMNEGMGGSGGVGL